MKFCKRYQEINLCHIRYACLFSCANLFVLDSFNIVLFSSYIPQQARTNTTKTNALMLTMLLHMLKFPDHYKKLLFFQCIACIQLSRRLVPLIFGRQKLLYFLYPFLPSLLQQCFKATAFLYSEFRCSMYFKM